MKEGSTGNSYELHYLYSAYIEKKTEISTKIGLSLLVSNVNITAGYWKCAVERQLLHVLSEQSKPDFLQLLQSTVIRLANKTLINEKED